MMDVVRILPHLMLCFVAVHAVPVIEIPPTSSTVVVRGSITLMCKVMNKGMYTVSWLKLGRVISNDRAIVSSAVDSTRYNHSWRTLPRELQLEDHECHHLGPRSLQVSASRSLGNWHVGCGVPSG